MHENGHYTDANIKTNKYKTNAGIKHKQQLTPEQQFNTKDFI